MGIPHFLRLFCVAFVLDPGLLQGNAMMGSHEEAEDKRRAEVSPSLLAANPLSLGEEVALIKLSGADRLHLDVMDGHFVPNLSFSPHVLKALKAHTTLPIDVHLMVDDPLRWVEPFQQVGAASLAFHIEAMETAPEEQGDVQVRAQVKALCQTILQGGSHVGLALSPNTPVACLDPFLDCVDYVLVMGVVPGKGGQTFLPQTVDRVAAIRENRGKRSFKIQVDGGVTAQNAQALWAAGADVLIAGTAIFSTSDYTQAIDALRPQKPPRDGSKDDSVAGA
jgi:ribulose-phosphate 3-epimerase